MKLPVSVVVITKNEEKDIKDCLLSASFASDILVVDSGSTDKTVEIATNLGARVLHREWDGFGPQKNWAVTQALNDWVLCLDADERVSKELLQELLQGFSNLNAQTLYKIPRVSLYLGQWIWHGGWFPDFQGRLFNRHYFQWDFEPIHEKVLGSGPQKPLSSPIEHHVFESVTDHLQTNLRYSKLLSKKDDQSGRLFFKFLLVYKPFVKFIECYFLKQGFRDGWAGFIIAINAAHSIFMRLCFRYEVRLPLN